MRFCVFVLCLCSVVSVFSLNFFFSSLVVIFIRFNSRGKPTTEHTDEEHRPGIEFGQSVSLFRGFCGSSFTTEYTDEGTEDQEAAPLGIGLCPNDERKGLPFRKVLKNIPGGCASKILTGGIASLVRGGARRRAGGLPLIMGAEPFFHRIARFRRSPFSAADQPLLAGDARVYWVRSLFWPAICRLKWPKTPVKLPISLLFLVISILFLAISFLILVISFLILPISLFLLPFATLRWRKIFCFCQSPFSAGEKYFAFTNFTFVFANRHSPPAKNILRLPISIVFLAIATLRWRKTF